MNENQILLAYIALGAGIIIALTLIVLIIVLWRRNTKLKKEHLKWCELFRGNIVSCNNKINDEKLKSERFTKFMIEQHDENASIYNAFRGNHNETLTKISNIDKTIEQHTNRLNLDNEQIERILIKLTPAPKEPEKYKVERPKKLGKRIYEIGVKSAPKKTTKKK